MLLIFFLIILVLFITLKFSNKIACFLSVICTFIILTRAIFIKQDWLAIVLTILAINSIPFIGYIFKRQQKKQLTKINRNKKMVTETVDKLDSRIKKLENVNKNLLDRTKETSNLYEATKDMSRALEFEQVFEIFNGIIKEFFDFDSCKFIVLKNKETPQKAYYLDKKDNQKSKISIIDLDKIDKKIIKKVNKIKSSFFISEEKTDPEKLSIDFELRNSSLIATPLISEDKIIGILVLTGLPYKEYVNFLIFSGQFALQLKKVTLYEKIRELAIKDELTGVLARRHFLQRFKEEFKRAVKHHLNLALLMLDIDHFKKYNDEYGHLVGDRLLKKIADIITEVIREIDLAGRFGGEEFALVLPDTDLSGAKLVANRIREEIEKNKFKVYDETITITASIGICLYPEQTRFFDDLINYADMALYRAKNGGRNKTCVYDAENDKFQYHKK